MAARALGTPGRKRLEIARVLATQPRLILLDEALAGLTRNQGCDRTRPRHPSRGMTIVIVEPSWT
jgi:branched-chain amino acid transport system ATP-binding protein